ncbi:MAG: hypothetical protein SNJ59_08190 [Aggregatilineales bacterium]
MIRLTVLYNLPPGVDETDFLRWRLGEHQQYNSSMEGVVRTDFARIDARWTPDDPQTSAPYRFMTIVDWPDQASFERGFLDPQVQAQLADDLKRIDSPLFLISEVLATSS